MRWNKSLMSTLREDPSDAEAISHKLMIRSGMVRQLSAGLYIYLPLGLRVIEKINKVIRDEMDSIGAQEVVMPVLHPAEIWQQTGRWYDIGDEMFRLKDRSGRDMVLGMTHEEIIAWMASREIRSYKDLPQIWYQIQTKLRDEVRPTGGVLRTREFLMKDSYSLDVDEDSMKISYDVHKEAYCKIFSRCGIEYYVVESDPGMMGGAGSHEFMAPSEAGEDKVAMCKECGYAANVELAQSTSSNYDYFEADNITELSTPDSRTVEEVCQYLGIKPHELVKSLLLISENGPVLALIRGDQYLHEKKVARIIGNFRPAHRDEVKDVFGVEAGFIGPAGIQIPKIADLTLKKGIYYTGANKDGFHLKGINPEKHFEARYYDIHIAQSGEYCTRCNNPIEVKKVIEVGNIFKLGTKYSYPLKAFYSDVGGKEKPIWMGSYGIGPARIAASFIEQNHDEDGIIWNCSMAPFDIHLLPVNINDKRIYSASEEVYNSLLENKYSVLYDNRDERAGIKFYDADLIGIPIRITVGTQYSKNGFLEIRMRKSKEEIKVTKDTLLQTLSSLKSTF